MANKSAKLKNEIGYIKPREITSELFSPTPSLRNPRFLTSAPSVPPIFLNGVNKKFFIK